MTHSNHETIYGLNPVYELLAAGRRRIRRILVARDLPGNQRVGDILAMAERSGIAVERTERRRLDAGGGHHQGIVAECTPYPYSDLADILARAGDLGEPPFVLVVDQLQDPQNLGAMMRSAEAVGVHGLVIPARRSAGVTPAVVRASSGASEHLRVARGNLDQAIHALKQEGLWVTGLERGRDSKTAADLDLSGPRALVVGAEGAGLSRLVRERCDNLLELPMRGRVESLNAAVAASLAMYAVWEARRFDGWKGAEVPLH
jgi:23S rRNA (guanosine2251-2'-O)-methyltransferase